MIATTVRRTTAKFLRPTIRCFSMNSNSSNASADHAYCLNLVKKNDFDNYLCGLIWPKQLQPAYFAIRAYNVEIATIRDQIKVNNNVAAGRMRFQWWRDGLEHMERISSNSSSSSSSINKNSNNISDNDHEGLGRHALPLQQEVPFSQDFEHPVLHQLQRTRTQQQQAITTLNPNSASYSDSTSELLLNRWNPRWLSRSLEARCSDLQISQYDSLEEVEQYAEQSASSILYALGDVLKSTTGLGLGYSYRAEQMEFCMSHTGVASGLTLLLRGLMGHLASGVCVLPREIMSKHGLSLDALFEITAASAAVAGGGGGGIEADQALSTRQPHHQQQLQLTMGQQQQRERLAAAVHDMASQAFAHQSRAQELQKQIIADPAAYVQVLGSDSNNSNITQAQAKVVAAAHLQRTLYLSLLPGIRSSIYLEKLQQNGFDALSPALHAHEMRPFPLDLQWRLLKSVWQRQI